jgi:hypothetical protein
MRDLLLLAVQLVVTLAKLARPSGVRSVIAESLLLKQQLLISRRSCRRAPSLTTIDRFVLGLMRLFVRPRRVVKVATILKPATLLRFHKALVCQPAPRVDQCLASNIDQGGCGNLQIHIEKCRCAPGPSSMPIKPRSWSNFDACLHPEPSNRVYRDRIRCFLLIRSPMAGLLRLRPS